MRKQNQLRGSRAAAAALALAFVAAPASATAHAPKDDCPLPSTQGIELSHELFAALEPAPAAAPSVVSVGQALKTADVVITRNSALDRELRARLQQIERQRVEISALEQVGHLATLEQVHRAVAWDRDVDIDRVIGDVTWRFETLDLRDEAAGPWEMVADAVVTAARFPARAGIVLKNLVGAAAKLTPRVARALF